MLLAPVGMMNKPPQVSRVFDTLTKYNIDNLAVNIAEDKFDDLPLPCMVLVSIKVQHYFIL